MTKNTFKRKKKSLLYHSVKISLNKLKTNAKIVPMGLPWWRSG